MLTNTQKTSVQWILKIVSFKQFCIPRAGNPENVLLTSRIRLKYFYQCYLLYHWIQNFNAVAEQGRRYGQEEKY